MTGTAGTSWTGTGTTTYTSQPHRKCQPTYARCMITCKVLLYVQLPTGTVVWQDSNPAAGFTIIIILNKHLVQLGLRVQHTLSIQDGYLVYEQASSTTILLRCTSALAESINNTTGLVVWDSNPAAGFTIIIILNKHLAQLGLRVQHTINDNFIVCQIGYVKAQTHGFWCNRPVLVYNWR